MNRARTTLVALMGLVPSLALAHGPGGHAADPDLHVDPTLDDCSIIFSADLTQGSFRRFAREFGSVSAFKLQGTPAPLGRWGARINLESFNFTIDDRSDAWNDTFHHPDAYHELGSDKMFPRARLRVGLSDAVDVGAYYTRNPNANYGWLGLDVSYAVLRQSERMPVSVALRGAYTKTLFVEDMDMHAFTTDVAVARTLWGALTPYVGVGSDLVLVRETSDAVELANEELTVSHAMGGVEYRLWHVAIGVEGYLSEINTFQFQIGAAF